MAKELLKTHETSFMNRPHTATVDYLTYGSADFSFAPYGPYWKFMKNLCMSKLLVGQTLDQLLPVRHEEITRGQSDEAIDVGEGLMRGFGKRLKEVRDRFDSMMEKIIKEHEEARKKEEKYGWSLGALWA
ncbi:cytochrome p450 93a3 [Quercus suber]|uniref:Cytochrome p450 93a3 n=1 Tax=Quercus suber TaxID=58331 RepID=A0AAW0LEC3_QUESU